MTKNSTKPLIIQTRDGKVAGERKGNVFQFMDIPYAAPPVGENRFAKPKPVLPWKGVRYVAVPKANSPHRTKPFPGLDAAALIGEGWVEGDDYLTLNVLRPTQDVADRPVMVFIHGGGFVVGSKDAPIQDGTSFAKNGIIYVAINYRMGVEGFLPIPGIPTNLGLRDQIAALQWVKGNISAFGGDSENITVFGESAGAMSIANLMASPLAQGLFKRAIIQSGHGGMTRSVNVMQRLVKKLAKILKIKPDEAGFRSKSQTEIFDAVEKVSAPTARIDLRDEKGHEPVFGISRFVPVHGDDVLPDRPLKALAKGMGRNVDLLIGTNAEEMNLYLVATGARDKIGKWLSVYLLHKSQPQTRKVLRDYGMGEPGKKPGQVLTDAMTDLVFRWPARRFAEEHQGQTHLYECAWRSTAFNGELGACHGIELPFVFNSISAATGPEGLAGSCAPQELADRTHQIWINFATTGDLPWAEFDRQTRAVYQLESADTVFEPVMPAAKYLL